MSPSRIVDSVAPQTLYKQIAASIDKHEAQLAEINKKIHDNPELKFEEYEAHNNICNLLEGLGYSVTRHTYGLDTSFEIEYGSGGRLVVFNAEYDALPGIGHACGHNLIATSSIAAFIATAEAIRENKIEGRVRLLGTPAEEAGGGKILLINAGAYRGVDACLMAHPGPTAMAEGIGGAKLGIDGTAAMKTLARKSVLVTFKGKNSHAGFMPWEGRNALDAVVSSYVNISLLRQQIPPTARIHGVIREGGLEPNIIPDSASLEYFIRDETAASVAELGARVEKCFKAGALATGCTVECDWRLDNDYKDLRSNMVLARAFTEHAAAFGRNYLVEKPGGGIGGSTDMGNVCYEVPGFHAAFTIPTESPETSPHTPAFATAAGRPAAFRSALDCGKAMAVTGFSILADSGMATGAWNEFESKIGPRSN